MLYRRNKVQSKDSHGGRLPGLKESEWFFYDSSDKRFKGSKPKTRRRRGKRKATKTVFVEGGYKQAKRRAGGQSKRDGSLSGLMWRSLTPEFKKLSKRQGGGIALRLHFAKGQRNPSTARTVYDIETRKRKIAFETEYVRNRTKAFFLQVKNRKSGRPAFDLMRFSDAEIKFLLQHLMRGLKLNGGSLAR